MARELVAISVARRWRGARCVDARWERWVVNAVRAWAVRAGSVGVGKGAGAVDGVAGRGAGAGVVSGAGASGPDWVVPVVVVVAAVVDVVLPDVAVVPAVVLVEFGSVDPVACVDWDWAAVEGEGELILR